MRPLRPILALLFAGLLLVTSQSMAVARGTMRDASGAMVLCTGTGPVTVLIDETGEPIGPSHICPDCALSVLAALSTPFVPPVPVRTARAVTMDISAPQPVSWRVLQAQARSPPSV